MRTVAKIVSDVTSSTLPSVASTVTIVLPCLDEAETLEFCIREIQAGLANAGVQGEVVVADNGSTDGSQQIAREAGARVVDVAERGYGAAILGGIAAAESEYIVMGDADGSYDFTHASRLVGKLDKGYDLVMGNRFLGGVQPGAMPWHHRYIGNPVLTWIGRLFFNSPVGDFHCGLRAFRKSAIEKLNLTTPGMEFASEMVIKATLAGLKICEVPTTLRPDGRSRPPHLRSFRDGWRHLRFMLLFCPRWLFAFSGSLFLLLGLAVMLVIALVGRISVGELSLNVNSSMAAAMGAIVGWQLLLTGVFARRFCTAVGTHPPSHTVQRWSKFVSLEKGILAGVAAILLGSGLFGAAFWQWKQVDFGPMSSDLTVSKVIPALTAIMLGVQTVFGSFLISLLSLMTGTTKRVEGQYRD